MSTMVSVLVSAMMCAGTKMLVSALLLVLMNKVLAESPKIFMNQYAVHIPGGHNTASAIADNHGFKNMGQVMTTQK
jgi:multisubunit Na+/H+ antiporter MnhB subunit